VVVVVVNVPLGLRVQVAQVAAAMAARMLMALRVQLTQVAAAAAAVQAAAHSVLAAQVALAYSSCLYLRRTIQARSLVPR
jgi:hypothetical protein